MPPAGIFIERGSSRRRLRTVLCVVRAQDLVHCGASYEDEMMNTKNPDAPKFGSNTYNKHDDHKGHAPRRARGKKRPTKEEMLEQMKKNAADKA